MLVLRYFAYVGGALLALLLICGVMLPKPQAPDNTVASAATTDDGPMLRIHSERKWPERIAFDTNAPMPASAQVAKAGIPAAPPPVAEIAAKTRGREAYAQLAPGEAKEAKQDKQDKPDRQETRQVAHQVKKAEPKVAAEPRIAPRRRVARARIAPSPYAPGYYAPQYYGRPPMTMQVAQQPRYGFFW